MRINNVRWGQVEGESELITLTSHLLLLFNRSFVTFINPIYKSITMSWLFGSSNGTFQLLFSLPWVEHLRNAPFYTSR